MKSLVFLVLMSALFLFLFSGCADRFAVQAQGRPGNDGHDGRDGNNGSDGVGSAISVSSAVGCANGGTRFVVFRDLNSNGIQNDDDVTTSISEVCNGMNGLNGNNGNNGIDGRDGDDGSNGVNGINASVSVQIATPAQCPTGGYTFTSSTGNTINAPVTVCNGIQGIAGLQGNKGDKGDTGNSGSAGTVITPVKFCTSDHSSYPEYGLIVGNQMFAVYWGTAPYSPSAKTAFLTLITPGSYTSTGGNGCSFTWTGVPY